MSNFNQTIIDLKTTSNSIKEIVKNNQSDIDSSIKNIKNFSEDFSQISNKLNQAQIDETLKNFKISSENLSNIINDINNGNGTMGQIVKNDSLFKNLNKASESIDLLLEDIRLNPYRYIHFSIFGKKNKPYSPNN